MFNRRKKFLFKLIFHWCHFNVNEFIGSVACQFNVVLGPNEFIGSVACYAWLPYCLCWWHTRSKKGSHSRKFKMTQQKQWNWMELSLQYNNKQAKTRLKWTNVLSKSAHCSACWTLTVKNI